MDSLHLLRVWAFSANTRRHIVRKSVAVDQARLASICLCVHIWDCRLSVSLISVHACHRNPPIRACFKEKPMCLLGKCYTDTFSIWAIMWKVYLHSIFSPQLKKQIIILQIFSGGCLARYLSYDVFKNILCLYIWTYLTSHLNVASEGIVTARPLHS